MHEPSCATRPLGDPQGLDEAVLSGICEQRRLYRAGESFYEAPNSVHLVSANASDRDPVRFLAYFTCDHDAPLSEAVP